MHYFGESSMKQYNTLHADLQLILAHTLIGCEVDFGISEGYRSPEKQLEYFQKGRTQNNVGDWIITNPKQVITNVDGFNIIGNHNHEPSIAVDLIVHVEGKPELTWDSIHLTFLAGSLLRIADRLYAEGRITHKVRWGGNWDKDGDLADNKLCDRPHFEIYKA